MTPRRPRAFMRMMEASFSLLFAAIVAGACGVRADEPQRDVVEPVPIAGMSEWHRQNLERNLRWMLTRESRRPAAPAARVAVFIDAGVWHLGARSIVESLEREQIPCQLLDRARLKTEVTTILNSEAREAGLARESLFHQRFISEIVACVDSG